LIGQIDSEKKHDGVITCKDGFTATTVGPVEFEDLARGFPVDFHIEEVDESSVFCVMTVRKVR
jgi:2-polyprenyl-6-hydroxyphenyl methylase/3-demethylubiquinone-9 3-methyltransferase